MSRLATGAGIAAITFASVSLPKLASSNEATPEIGEQITLASVNLETKPRTMGTGRASVPGIPVERWECVDTEGRQISFVGSQFENLSPGEQLILTNTPQSELQGGPSRTNFPFGEEALFEGRKVE